MLSKIGRAAPATFVIALLVLVVRAQPPCEIVEVPRTSTYQPPLPLDQLTVRQAFNVTLVARTYSDFEVSLGPSSPQAEATLVIAFDDAATGRPTTQTAMLHARHVVGTEVGQVTDFQLSRPIVWYGVTGTAQQLPKDIGLYVRVVDPQGPETIGYTPDVSGAAVTMTAHMTAYSLQGELPVPGPNPRLAFTACLQPESDLRVLQQVVSIESSPVIVFGETEIAQEFTVPVTSTVQWLELVSRSENGQPPSELAIEIFEIESSYAIDYPIHGTTMTATVLRAANQGSFEQTRWMASDPFGFRPWLEPGRLYVMRMRIIPQAGFPGGGVAFLGSASEGVHQGKLYMRYAPTDPPFEVPSDLSFRLIGTEGLDERAPEMPGCPGETIVAVSPTATIDGDRLVLVHEDNENRPIGSAAYALCLNCATYTPIVVRIAADAGSATPIRTDTYALDVIRAPTGTVHGPWVSQSFSRPLVTVPVTHTSQPTRAALATDFRAVTGTVVIGARAAPTGTAQTVFRFGPGGWEGLTATPTAVLCGVVEADGTNGSNLRVLQQVVTVDDPAPESDFIMTPTTTATWLQYFSSPVTATVSWVEVALGGLAVPAPQLQLSLYDATTIDPSTGIIQPTATAVMTSVPITNVPSWHPSARFPAGTALQANHPYALVAEVQHAWTLGTRVGTGTATLLARNGQGLPFQPVPGRSLSYRIIGIPIETPTDTRTPFESNRFALRIGPNPASANFALSWAGGAGRTALDITDVRGRRVLQLRDVGTAVAGRWTWEGRDAQGRPLPAGVYFVRLRDARGSTATERVVILR